ncbi:hypothetical protein [Aeromonas veronii]|uniref:hypothetical protein n=1 Tax=Aeromonas veronii TaxID=654 RepID=UPI003D199B68
MSKRTPEIIHVTIVLIGNFEPKNISPGWLAYHKLVDRETAANVKDVVVSDELSQIIFDWGAVVIDRNRLQISTKVDPIIKIKDFALSLIGAMFNALPILKFGINYQHHYMFSHVDREKLGIALSPRKAWGAWGDKLTNNIGGKNTPYTNGLFSITMTQGAGLLDREDGSVNVNVTLSDLITGGVKISVNDHFDLGDEKTIFDSEKAYTTIERVFDASLDNSNKIINGIIEATLS